MGVTTRDAPATRREASAAWLAERTAGPMRPGAVLVHAPTPAFQAPGGGETQLLQTARHLESLGLAVRPFVPWTDRVEAARLVHLFGMSREGLALARVARSRGVPVVLSPICWYDPRSLAALAANPAQAAWDVAKWGLRAAAPRWPAWRRELLALADRVLPNSEAEARQLGRLFGVGASKLRVVPNGVEPRFERADPVPIREVAGDGPFVLSVGRIEPRKNTLGVIRAARSLGLPALVIGDPVPGCEAYALACRRAGQGVARFVPRLGHDDPRLASAYAASRVFALPSWFETPGLAALEAGLAGSAVVVTPFGCTREYFGDRVRYARPGRHRELAAAIAGAWEDGAVPGLSRHIRSHYLWSNAARKTAEVYDELAD